MWYPTRQELIDAGVVTKVAGLDDVALSGLPPSDTTALDGFLRVSPVMDALAQHHAEAYRSLVAEYPLGFQRGDSLGDVRRRTLPAVTKVVWSSVPVASDEAVVNFTNLLLDQLKTLYSTDPRKCQTYLSGQDSSDLLTDLAPTLDREQRAEADVIATAAAGVRASPKEYEVTQDMTTVMASLQQRFGSDLELLQHVNDPTTDPARYCQVVYGLYSEALELRGPRAARLLRYLFSE